MTIKNTKHGKPNSDPVMTGNDRVLKWYTVQEVAKKEGYYKGTKCKELCKAFIQADLKGIELVKSGRTFGYRIREDKVPLFKNPNPPKQKEEGATRKGSSQHLLNPCSDKLSDKTNLKTTGSHEIIIEETEENAKKQPSNIDEMEKVQKPDHDLPKTKKIDPFTGYITLLKKLRQWRYYRDSFILHVFIELLLKANYQDSTFMGVPVKRGQVIAGYGAVSEATGIPVRKVRRAFNKLQDTQEIIRVAHPKENKFSLYDIPNYGKYQPQPKNAKKPPKIHSQDTQQKPFKPSTEEERIAYSILQGINEESFHNYQPTQNNLQPIINQLRRGYTEEELEKILQNKLSDIEENRHTGEPDPSMNPSILYGDDFDEWREISGILAKK